MRTRSMRGVTARNTWARLRVSFWFAPSVMALVAVLLAWLVYWVDQRIPNEVLGSSRFVLAGTPSEMRTTLLNMAGTVLATAGVVFSLLTLPLSTVASQYGSRLLRVFLGDRTAQLVLSMFVGTFVYCVAAALSIPPASVEPEGPQLTATVGLYLMLATFATLILLVQHISTLLQAPNIAAAAGAELLTVIDAELQQDATRPENGLVVAGSSPGSQVAPADLREADAYAIRVSNTGYVQYIDPAVVQAVAREKDLVIRLLHRPGRFVSPGGTVALVWPADRVSAQIDSEIRRAFRIGNDRTPTQDMEYAVNQLTEMAVRAMSPAINDPFTAMTCLDHLGNGLTHYARLCGEDSATNGNGDQHLLLCENVTFGELLGGAFDMLRHASCDNAAVLLHMLATAGKIGRATRSSEARQLLRQHVNLMLVESRAGHLIEDDLKRIDVRGQTVLATLELPP